HIAQTAFDFNPSDENYRDYPFVGIRANPNDPKALRPYTESYVYDEVGNFVTVTHTTDVPLWVRSYVYQEPSVLEGAKQSNRLTSTSLECPPNYTYDAHGNMTSMPHLRRMDWNYRDQLQATARQKVNSGTPETTWYVYGADGQRLRKVTDH